MIKGINKLLSSLMAIAILAIAPACGGGSSTPATSNTATAPSAPTGVSATAGTTQATVSWTASTDATSYNVYYGTSAGVTTANGTKVAGATSGSAITGLTAGTAYYFIVTAVNSAGESAASSSVSATPTAAVANAGTSTPNDPLFADQWHLKNTGQAGADAVAGTAGQDLNVTGVWVNYTGAGVRIAIVDDGMDINHEDLPSVAGKSWDFRTGAYGDPSSSTSSHGTSCAGLAAAKGNNGIGVTGVAYNAEVVGYNLLDSGNTTGSGADAVTKDLTTNHLYSNSYGATDSTGKYYESSSAWQAAIDTGVTTGRSNKGAIYTWAAGNGATGNDRTDYDGQANYRNVIAIGSLNDKGQKSSYSEEGSNLLVSAFGGEFCTSHTTTTTDITGTPGYNNGTSSANDYNGNPNYTKCMNGTSAATPEASGVVALLLSANPNLTYRDVRYILAKSARKTDATDADWVNNGAGLPVNHKYGYGAIDASAAITLATASNWATLPDAATPFTSTNSTAFNIADGTSTTGPAYGATATSTISVSTAITKIEFVDVTVNSAHPEPGDLNITLTSPSGTVSTLAVQHDCSTTGSASTACGAWTNGAWRFGVARLIDEAPNGTWTLSASDGKQGNTGSVTSWKLDIYGR